jgi:hypothetical protein
MSNEVARGHTTVSLADEEADRFEAGAPAITLRSTRART